MKPISLSPSKLGDFYRCHRCFWISENMGIKPPRGIFPSLPGGIDRVVKTYFDNYRGSLPPELKGKLPGILMADMGKISKWRNWRSGLACSFEKEQVRIGGALDDCLIDGEIYIPIDNKTKGNKPADNGAQYYQTQLDCYNMMLWGNDYQTRDEGHLLYWYPEIIAEGGNIRFGVDIFKLTCSKERGKEILFKAAECLRGPIPAHAGCDLCEHILCRSEAKVIYDRKEGDDENNKAG